MGTWGSGIFSDDVARDVRDEWRDLIADGLTPRDATDKVIDANAAVLRDPDDGPVFWIALAVAQWKTGRLVDDVRDRAIAVIESGQSLDRWVSASARRQRERVLMRARDQLLSPQRPPTKVRKAPKSSTPFQPGDVLSYRHRDGTYFALWVSTNMSDRGGEYNAIELLDYAEAVPPQLQSVIARSAMPRYWQPRTDGSQKSPDAAGFLLMHADRLPRDRVTVLGNQPRPTNRPRHPRVAVFAEDMDRTIDGVRESIVWRRTQTR